MLPGSLATAVLPPPCGASLGPVSGKRRHCEPSNQYASCNVPSLPDHQSSMLFGTRETTAMFDVVAALPGGASWYRVQLPPSYQYDASTAPLPPTHHTSML